MVPEADGGQGVRDVGGIIFDDVFIVLLQFDIHLRFCDTVGGGGGRVDQSWVKDNSKDSNHLVFGPVLLPHQQHGAELKVPPPLLQRLVLCTSCWIVCILTM